jgi:hypothetical protein
MIFGVKGQGQTVIMMVRETLSHHYTTTYQISLTYLKRQKVIAQTQKHLKKLFVFLDRLMIFGMWLYNDERVSHVPS